MNARPLATMPGTTCGTTLRRRLTAALALTLSGALTIPTTIAVAGESDQIAPTTAVPAPAAGLAAAAGSITPAAASQQALAHGLAALGALHPTTKLSPTVFQAAMVRALTGTARSRYLGARLSGLVMDVTTGSVLWNHNAYRAKMPASTQKLMTAFTVLRSMNPDQQFVTRARQSTTSPSVVYLTGAGDPSFTTARMRSLALRTATALRTKRTTAVNVYVDDTVFPAPTATTGWKASYLKSDVQLVRGLTLAGYRGKDGAAATGAAFAKYLRAYRVKATYRGRARTAPRTTVLADSWSPPVRSLVQSMLAYSNNDYAEYLLRHAARARGLTATTRNAVANHYATLTAAGIGLSGYRAYDGSGLSRSNRMPARVLAETVLALYRNDRDRAVVFAWGGMPRAGQTGTLRTRFRARTQLCARGRVLAKTGTLNDVVSLAGIAQGSDGRDRVFVLLENGLTAANAVRLAMDEVATGVVGCRLG